MRDCLCQDKRRDYHLRYQDLLLPGRLSVVYPYLIKENKRLPVLVLGKEEKERLTALILDAFEYERLR